MTTHFVLTDGPGRVVQAVCGRFVNPEREHAIAPTCPRCAEVVAERNAEAEDDEPRRPSLTRQERLQAQADAGYDTLDWEER